MTNTLDLHKKPCSLISFSVRGNDNSLSGNNFSLSDNDISLSDNDFSLSGNEISLTGNEISHMTQRNLATTGTRDVPKYRAIFRSNKISLKFAEISRFWRYSSIIVFINFAQYCNI